MFASAWPSVVFEERRGEERQSRITRGKWEREAITTITTTQCNSVTLCLFSSRFPARQRVTNARWRQCADKWTHGVSWWETSLGAFLLGWILLAPSRVEQNKSFLFYSPPSFWAEFVAEWSVGSCWWWWWCEGKLFVFSFFLADPIQICLCKLLFSGCFDCLGEL